MNSPPTLPAPCGRFGVVIAALAAIATLLVAVAPGAAQPGSLFPQPFVHEHHPVHTDDTGDRFVGDTVTDYYGGSWIVSVRSNRSRMVVDLARRELTEIDPERGTFWSLSFDRFAELRERYLLSDFGRDELSRSIEAEAELRRGSPTTLDNRSENRSGDRSENRAAPSRIAGGPTPHRVGEPGSNSAEEPTIEVSEVTSVSARSLTTAPPLDDASATLLARPSVRRYRVVASFAAPASARDRNRDAETPAAEAEVWVDESIRLEPQARRAIAGFEQALATPAGLVAQGAPSSVSPGRLLGAVREQSGGAFPVRTVRPLFPEQRAPGSLEDVATRLEPVSAFPIELVEVPDGFRRVSHPLELLLAVVDSPSGREAMAGNPPERPEQP